MADSTGRLTDQFTVDKDGGASYAFELKVPPGTAELAPSLSLAYNSGGGDGMLGVGWGLGGLSSITRTGQTMAQDGRQGSVGYDAADRFILDGQRLMAVAGTYGQPGAVYHTEIQTWQKVIPQYPAGWDAQRGPQSFIVHTRDGRTLEYGATVDSRVPASSTLPAIRLWSLNRVTDRHGNFMTLTYELDTQNNVHYPKVIEYTDNVRSPIARKRQVRFTYVERQDVSTLYIGGYPVRTTRLLTQVQTYVGDSLVRTYRLDYQLSKATQRSLLQSVTTEARDTSLPRTTFLWQGQAQADPTLFQGARALPQKMQGGLRIPMDVSGNGLSDVLHAYHVSQQLKLDLYLSTGSGLEGPFPVDLGGAGLPWGGTFSPLDVDADGHMDLVYAANNGGRLGLTLLKAVERNGRWTLALQGTINGAGPSDLLWGGRLLSLDVDGDGRTDLVYATNSSSLLELTVLYSDGSRFSPSSGGPTRTQLIYGGHFVPMDVNGDGLTDLVYATNDGGFLKLTWLKALNDRQGLQPQDAPLLPAGTRIPWGGSLLPMNLNGDGTLDLLNPYSDGTTLHLRALHNTGRGFVLQDLGSTGLVFGSTIPQLMPADVTGSGRDDLVLVGEHRRDGTTSRIAVLLNHGGTLRAHAKVSQVPPYAGAGETTEALGLTGVGKADLLHVDGTGAVYLLAATPEYPDLVSSLTNGLGGRFDITYKPLTDASVYSKNATSQNQVDARALFNNQLPGATYTLAANPGAQTPAVGMSFASRSVQYPRYVVAGYTQVYSPRQSFRHGFFYAGAKLNLQGRGWLGFAAWNKTDPDTGPAGVVTETRYHQDFPLTYAVASQTVRRASDQALMARSEYTYATPASAGVHQLQTKEVKKKQYTFARADTPDIVQTRSFQYDGYGNTTLISLTTTDPRGSALYTHQKYQNSEALHRFGFVTEVKHTRDPQGNQPLKWERKTYTPEAWDVLTHSRWTHGDTWQVYTYQYDAWGNQTRLEDPARAVVTYQYETTYHTFPSKRVLPATASGRVLEVGFQYDAGLGVLVSQTWPNGVREDHAHDGLGRPVETRSTSPDGTQVATLRYQRGRDATGAYRQTLTRQDWTGDRWKARTEYVDGFGRVFRATTQGLENGALVGRAVLEDTVLDSHDQPVEQSLPYFSGDTPKTAQVLTYDEFGRVTRREASGAGTAPNVTTYAYPETNRAVITEGATSGTPRSRTQTYALHGDTRCLAELLDARGHTTRYAYDGLGRRVSVVDPKAETTFAYDGLDRQVSIIHRAGTTTFTRDTYAYQDDQRRWTYTDTAGVVTTFQYDSLQRLLSRQAGTARTTFTYDEPTSPWSLGYLTGVQLPDGASYVYGYDSTGNRASVKLTLDGTVYTLNQDHTPSGLVSRVVYPDAARSEVNYQYDAVQRLLNITGGGNQYLVQSDFTALGAPGAARNGNGVRTAYTYTADGHLLTQDVFDHQERKVVSSALEWDPFWQVRALRDRLETPRDQAFTYDAVGQLERAQGGFYGTRAYAYDGACNLTEKDGLKLERSGYQITGGFEPSNTQVLTTRYDANGSLVELRYQGATTHFEYDAEHRLRKAGDVRFTYDHDGRRLTKAEPGLTTYYVAPCYEVVVFSNGARQHTRYILDAGQTLASITQVERGSPPTGLVGVPAPGVRYFHVNNTQSTVLQTNERGEAVNAMDYDPFGAPRLRSGSDDFRRKYTGLELDSTGLYYCQSRYYSPLLGGFITMDTQMGAGEAQVGAFNRYAYVLNDPITFTDPSGHGFFGDLKNFFTNTLPNWFSRHWKEIVTYAVDIALLVGGIGLLFVPGLQGVAAFAVGVAAGGLVGAGLGGLAYNVSTSVKGEQVSFADWGIQVGIGAAAGAIAGGFAGVGELAATSLNLTARSLANFGLRAAVDVVGGVVSGVSSQLIGNSIAGVSLSTDLAFAALFGGATALLGSAVNTGGQAWLTRSAKSLDGLDGLMDGLRKASYNLTGDTLQLQVQGMRQVMAVTLGGTLGTSVGYTLSYLHAEQFLLPGMK